jgi:hypothetical protein
MSPKRPTVGDVYRRDLLQSQATYRVLAVGDDHVEVEVVEAPGLEAGFRLKLTTAGLATMQLLEPAPGAVTAPARGGAQRHVASAA